jgi:hypothetical protein
MSNLFQTLELAAFRSGITPRTRQSREWFRQKARQITGIDRQDLMGEEEVQRTSSEIAGHMYMFFYDPKTKDKLPYYDRFPLVIVVGPAEGGFYGLNLHYLQPIVRAKFLDALLEITNNNRYDDTTKFSLSYKLLKRSSKLRYFAPCFKHYLSSHVKGRFAKISAPEYEIATFLPTADFAKAGQSKVYMDSRKIINAL